MKFSFVHTTIFALILLVSCAGSPDIQEQDTSQEYEIETVVEGIAVPWGMVWLPNGDMLITNRSGDLHIFRDGALLDDPVQGLPEVNAFGQGGLMDLELHPNYEENGWIYISYSSPEGSGSGANTAIMRARLENNSLVDKEVLYKAQPNSRRGQHFGGRIEFDKEGYLYFSVGDRGNRDVYPQDITSDNGKVYRLNDDGSIPEDNPYVGQEGLDAIYSYGHRNPQGMAMHPETGQIWTHEHGPRGGDEVNIIEKGKNYGWPVISFGINYSGTEFAEDTARAGMEQPEWYWDPSIAPSGMAFVTSDIYSAWKGNLMVGSLKFNYIVLCTVEDNNRITGEKIVFNGIGRVRNIRQGPDGYIYVATEGNGIVRIVPKES